MTEVEAWGRLVRAPHEVHRPRDRAALPALVRATAPGLAHGAGRSYGDQALNPGGVLWQTGDLDRFIAFDEATGRLRCEAGVHLRAIQALVRPRGWSLPVVPGTQHVSVGGAIANDVHGKNHHRQGSFGDHVVALELVRTDGSVRRCGPTLEADWWRATVGGLGLTGVVSEAELQLVPSAGPWLDAETIAFDGLPEFFERSAASEADWEHTVAWVDCARRGPPRGLFARARPAADQAREPAPRRARTVPLTPPWSLVNPLSLRAFNAAYHARGARARGVQRVAADTWLYPLDALARWNRIYGPRGFYQYQSLVPWRDAAAAVQAQFDAISASGQGSFLAVLKTFGERRGPGLLSFAAPGVTLALDFPNRGAATHALFERLDAIVASAGGRLYPAKDARMPRTLFEAGYPQAPAFARFRDPGIRSAMAARLFDAAV